MIEAENEISIDTVRSHIRKIYEKLHVHSQTEAVSRQLMRSWFKKVGIPAKVVTIF